MRLGLKPIDKDNIKEIINFIPNSRKLKNKIVHIDECKMICESENICCQFSWLIIMHNLIKRGKKNGLISPTSLLKFLASRK